jgi:hypothetical protein
MADITQPRHLNPPRRRRTYPRAVKRARHNSYRVKTRADTGVRHPGPPAIMIARTTRSGILINTS